MRFICLFLLFISFSAYSETILLTNQNTLALNGPVEASSVTSLMLGLQKLNDIETNDPIYLVLNSPGGSIYDGFDFIRFAQSSKRPIHTITIFAASMAFQLVQSLGTRYVTSYSTLMSHKASGGFSGQFPGELDSRYAHVLSHIFEQEDVVVKKTNGKQTKQSYARLIQDEYWANATKAIEDGFADKQVIVACDKSLSDARSETVDMGLFSVDVMFSNCPLITQPLSISVSRGAQYVIDNKIDTTVEYKKLFELKNARF